MATQPPQITTVVIPSETKKPMNLKGVISSYFYHWPLFLLGLIVTFAIAIVYLKFAKPVYEINATVIIKDNKKGSEQQSALSEIDLLNSAKLVENEMEVLKSNRLISQIVKQLELEINYKVVDGLHANDLYNSGPVKLILMDSIRFSPKVMNSNEKKAVSIVIKDRNSYYLKDADKQLKEYKFNEVISSSWGSWKLQPTPYLEDYKDETIKISVLDPKELTLQYQKDIEISIPNKLATSITLTLEDQVAQRGKDILNQLILNYNRFGLEENASKAEATLAFLDSRLDSLTEELNIAEGGIEGYKSSRGITDINTESKINLENIQTNDRSLNEINVQLSIINGIESYVNSKTEQVPATIGITDPALNSLIENLSRLQLQRSSLLAVSPETNPDFEPINRQIATTRKAIIDKVASIKSSLLNARSKLLSFNRDLETSIKKIPTQERQLASIQRQQAVKESLYTYLLQKREEIAANYANVVSTSEVIDQAYAGKAKAPPKALAFAFALILGLGMPFGIIYLRSMLDSSIIEVQEIKESVDIPVLAEIFYDKSHHPLSFSNSDTTIISEQLRALRTNLYSLYGNKTSGRVTLVTSSINKEGKTFISSNLAVALAHTGRKTVILDIDLRQPQLKKPEDLTIITPGITDFLEGKSSIDSILNPSEYNPNLYTINSGTVVNNPSELLEKGKLNELLAKLKSTFDDIIIDSPAVHLVPDALILSRLTDVTLYIIKQGYTQKTELNFVKELNDKKQLTNLHIVFNGIQKAKYGYGYSYANNYNFKSKKSIFGDFWKRF